MTTWKTFDNAADAAKLATEQAETERNERAVRVVECPHRRPKGRYDIRCKHPQRQPNRLCVHLLCPALFGVLDE